jgi:hypothetical protein
MTLHLYLPDVDVSEELPTLRQRQAGAAWLRLYGDDSMHDPFFVASCVYRVMQLAKAEPDAMELRHLWAECE